MTPPAVRVLEGRLRTYRHTWRGSVFTTFLSPVVFLGAMGIGLGSLIDRGGTPLPGGSYLAFLAPGLLGATAMQVAASESALPVMAGFKWLRTYEAALATPVRPVDLVLGQFAWVAVRLLLACGVFALVAAALGALPLGGGLLAVLPALLIGLAFSAPVIAYAASLENEYGLSGLFRFGVVPMFLFSGTFFPVTQLPDWVVPVAYATPLWHGVQLTRAAALGVETAAPGWLHIGYLLVWVGVGLLLATRQFERRLRW